jgi:V/A-type H+/Na+-transporting ATPase subunit K
LKEKIMNETLMFALGYAGAFSAIAFAGIRSALDTGAAGSAAIGAWKKCYAQNKPAPFQLLILAGAPLSQTIYGMVVMFLALNSFVQPEQWPFFLMLGVFGGVAMGFSAWMQGQAGAGACDAFAETDKGFTNYLMALGIIETVAIFIMAFAIVIMAMRGGNFKPETSAGANSPVPIAESANK